MAAAQDVQALLARIGSPSKLRLAGLHLPPAEALTAACRPLVLAWPGLEEVLPDGGLPRGVVEFTAPRALGGATSLALAAVRAGQECAREAWCAWIDPEVSLHAPGVVAAGVDLTRLLLVCPPSTDVGRSAIKVVGSGAFEVVVIDFERLDSRSACAERLDGGSAAAPPQTPQPSYKTSNYKRTLAPEVLVRKLALLAEQHGTTVLLLTDSTRRRAMQWPVALRLELARPSRTELSVRVAKDRRGRVSMAKTIPFRPLLHAST